jgi:glutathione S-transferase
MPQLYHHPLCPHSRFVRLALGEFGVEAELIEERVHERRREFLMLDPAGRTPVLVEDNGLVIAGAGPIAEWLDETLGERLGDHRLLPPSPVARVEVRRLMAWFNEKFFDEVSNWLVTEKVYKRFTATEIGGGGPDMDLLRAARANGLRATR